jgi:hypothetical protein
LLPHLFHFKPICFNIFCEVSTHHRKWIFCLIATSSLGHVQTFFSTVWKSVNCISDKLCIKSVNLCCHRQRMWSVFPEYIKEIH